jgi:predicted membrane channel-forming protein YqfA (hemolysin III family)
MNGTTDEVPGRKALAAVWLVGSTIIAMPAFLLTFASDQSGDRAAGAVLVVLVTIGVAAALISLNTPSRTRFRATLVAGLMWFISGVMVYYSQEFLGDAIWAGGVPIATAVAAVVTLLFSGRPPEVGG